MQTKQGIKEIRCVCTRLLAKVECNKDLGIIEIKCSKCKKINIFRVGVDTGEDKGRYKI